MEMNAAASTKTKARRTSPRGALREANDAWLAGDWERAIALLGGVELETREDRVEAAFLLARAALRAGQAARALVALDDAAELPQGPDERVTAAMLRGTALVRLGRLDEGTPLLERAVGDAAVAHHMVRAEAGYALAHAYFSANRLDDAESALDAHADPNADIVHARALEYRAWVAVARTDYAAATRLFADALRRLDGCRHYDRFLEATAIHGIALLASERLDRTAWLQAEPRALRFDWSADGLAHPYHLMAIHVSVIYEAEGRIREALRATHDAERIAISPAHALYAQIRRAAILRVIRERYAHDDLVAAIRRGLDEVAPSSLQGDLRWLPLALAEEIAYAGDVFGARALVKRFHDLPSPSRMSAMADDPRDEAYQLFVDAVVADASGDLRDAHARYQRAFQIYHRIGYERRALLAALRLGELTGQAYLLEYVDRTLRKLSARSPLRERARLHNRPLLETD